MRAILEHLFDSVGTWEYSAWQPDPYSSDPMEQAVPFKLMYDGPMDSIGWVAPVAVHPLSSDWTDDDASLPDNWGSDESDLIAWCPRLHARVAVAPVCDACGRAHGGYMA
jgi:hypothetical protein